jgi:hypothetical protein
MNWQAVRITLDACPQCEYAPAEGSAGRADASCMQREERALLPLLFGSAANAQALLLGLDNAPCRSERTNVCPWCSAGGRALVVRYKYQVSSTERTGLESGRHWLQYEEPNGQEDEDANANDDGN